MKNSDFQYQKVLPYMNPNVTNKANVKRSLPKPLPNFLARGQSKRILRIRMLTEKWLEQDVFSIRLKSSIV